MDNLKYLIKQKYGSVVKFATDAMGMKYETFNYNVRKKSFDYKQIKKLLDILGIKFEDLQEFQPVKAQTETQSTTGDNLEKNQLMNEPIDFGRTNSAEELLGKTPAANAPRLSQKKLIPPPTTLKPNPPLKKQPVIVKPEPEILAGSLQEGENLADFMRRQAAAHTDDDGEAPPGFLEDNPMKVH